MSIAKEHRQVAMHLLPLGQILKRVKTNQNKLNKMHMNLKSQQN